MSNVVCVRAAAFEEGLWEGTLDPAGAEITRHADSCSECRAILSGVASAQAGLAAFESSLTAWIPDAGASWNAVVARLDAPARKAKRGFIHSWVSGGWSAAAALLAVAVGTIATFVALGGPLKNMYSNAASSAPLMREAPSNAIRRGEPAPSAGLTDMAAPAEPARAASEPFLPATAPRVERSAALSIEVEDARAAHKRVTGMIAQNGGTVITSRVLQAQANQPAEARLTLRIPEAKFDIVIAELRALGEIKTEEIKGDDRTQDYRDIEARLADRDAAAQGLRNRLASGAAAQEEIARIEAELGRIRRERDEIETVRRDLSGRTDFSTISLTLAEPPRSRRSMGMFLEDFLGPFSSSLSLALRLLSGSLSILLIAAGALLPWAVLVALLWLLTPRGFRARIGVFLGA